MIQDLRYGVRMMLQNKSWTAVALLSLALGISANTALFSVVDAQLLRALPVKNPEELVRFMWVSGPNDMAVGVNEYGYLPRDKATGLLPHNAFSYPTFERLRASNQILSDLFAFAPADKLNVLVDGQAEIASGQFVSGNYFASLGVQATFGRIITTDDDKPGANPVALISHGYWQRRFGLDPSVVGKTVSVNKVLFTIIGIAPREFSGTLGSSSSLPSVSIPLAMEPRLFGTASRLNEGFTWWLLMMGRSKPGVSMEQVRANLEGIFQQSAQEGWDSYVGLFRPNPAPDQPGIRKAAVQHQELMRQRRLREIQQPRDKSWLRVASGSQGVIDFNPDELRALAIRMTVVGLVLLIVCANVANLLLARAATRQKEVAMRLALGATRLRLIRQLLTESALLAVLAGTLGVLLAVWSKNLLLSWFQIHFALDWRVLGFTAAISLFTAILFGLAPALRATRVDLMPAVKNSLRDSGGSRSFLTKSLLVAQVAMSLVLLIGAGLFIGTLRNLHSIDPGFNPENLLLFRADARLIGYTDDPWVNTRITGLYERIIDRLEALPGVRSASLSMYALLSGNAARSDGTLSPRPGEAVHFQAVRANFFETMQMPIVLGRSLRAQDDGRAAKVAVVNETLARRFYPNANPLGQRIGGQIGGIGDIEIVGIVRDTKYETLRQDIPPAVYLPYLQFKSLGEMSFEVRTAGDPGALVPAIREAVRQVEPNLPLTDVKTQIEQVDQTLAQERLFAFSSSLFGGLGMLLACVGLYGILCFSVTRRTHEIGVRMALGARRVQVMRMVMTEALWMVAGGIAVGLVTALAVTRLIASMLYGLAPNDALTIMLAIAVMIAVATLAGYLPAIKAARVDPMVALRDE